MDFGKDLGLVHEAVVTGRKVSAGSSFWAALAHSQKAFEIVLPLALHVSITERLNIDTDVSVLDKTKKLEEWLISLDKTCCIYCDTPKAEVLGMQPWTDKLGEELNTIKHSYYRELEGCFFKALCEKLGKMNIHPLELCATLEGWEETDPCLISRSKKVHDSIKIESCISLTAFLDAVRKIIQLRQFIAQSS